MSKWRPGDVQKVDWEGVEPVRPRNRAGRFVPQDRTTPTMPTQPAPRQESKPWYRSLTLWGIIGTAVALVAPEVGELLKDGLQPSDFIPIATLAVAFVGRVISRKNIGSD